MLNKLKEMRALNAFARKQSVGMQHKLMFYWLSMILTVFALVMLLLSAAGTFSKEDDRLNQMLKIQLQNSSDQEYVIQPGDRIAQLMVAPVIQAKVTMVDELDETARGAGGFGSTGK